MSNRYYNRTTYPASNAAGRSSTMRTELDTIDDGFDAVQAEVDALDTATTAALALKAPLASPALTGTPTAPTAAAGTDTTQIATTKFVADAIMTAALSAEVPSQGGNSGKFLYTDGASASWRYVAGMADGTSQSGSVVLTAASESAQNITPTGWGQSVTLPDATTMTKGVQVYAIRNAGAYQCRIKDDGGTTLGFLGAGETTLVSLADNSTAAGVWGMTNVLPFGTGALLRAADPAGGSAVGTVRAIALDSDRTFVIAFADRYVFAVVYNHAANTWGSITQIRDKGSSGDLYFAAIKCGTDKVLVVSCPNAGTAMEAVVVSASGTTLTVHTADKASITLAGALNNDLTPGTQKDTGLIQVGSSFLVQYARDTTTRGIRAITISGTTPTVGAETALDGTTNSIFPMFAVSATVALVFSYTLGTTTVYAKPYTISGTTFAPGTGCSFLGTTVRATQLGTRYAVVSHAGTDLYGTIVDVTGDVATDSNTTLSNAAASGFSVLTVGSKIAVAWYAAGGTAVSVNYLYDNAGTATKATAGTFEVENALSGLALLPDGTATSCRLFYRANSNLEFGLVAADISGGTVSLTAIGHELIAGSGKAPAYPTAINFYNTTSTLYDDYWAVNFKGCMTGNGVLMAGKTLLLYPNVATVQEGSTDPIATNMVAVVDIEDTCLIEIQEMAKWY